MSSNVTSVTALMRDMYPLPGERIKQWVVDRRREAKWESETCPTSVVAEHRDNTDALCRNVPMAIWIALDQHDCCYVCNDQAEREKRERCDVHNWLVDRKNRPPIEQDHDKLSDEVQPDYGPLPSLAFMRRR